MKPDPVNASSYQQLMCLFIRFRQQADLGETDHSRAIDTKRSPRIIHHPRFHTNQAAISAPLQQPSIVNLQSSAFSLIGKVVLFLALFNICFSLDQGLCGEIRGLETGPARSDDPVNRRESKSNIGAWFASSVWKHISAVDGQRCPSDPTCSSYSAQAFRKHGFFIGWLMTVDRLIHEADEGRRSPVVKRNGEFKILDPVENNDFWWYSENEKERD